MQDFLKVVWSEGVFIVPQHLQQLDRYHETRLNNFISKVHSNFYGVLDLSFDHSRFKEGTLGINTLQAVFQDGTIYAPQDNEINRLTLNVPKNISNKKIYLVILPISDSVAEVSFSEYDNVETRYYSVNKRVYDTSDIQAEPKEITVAKLNVKLQLEDEVNERMIKLPIAIISSDNDSAITIESAFIPPCLNTQNQKLIKSYISEICGLLSQKSLSLANSVNDPDRGGTIELINFLMLQTINRYLAYFTHQKEGTNLTHPSDLFANISKLCADLTTFLPERVMQSIPIYNHDALYDCYTKIMFMLRKSLTTLLEQRAIRIPLEMRDDSTYIAQTPNSTILNNSSFILAAKADMPTELLRSKLPNIIKISTIEHIRELVGYHLPGIKLLPLPTAPKELPYHSGYVYFELDKDNKIWKQFNNSSGMALHLAGDFPNIDFEFWAIKMNEN